MSEQQENFQTGSFKVTSKDFTAGGNLKNEQAYKGHGCNGENKSPELTWSNVPVGAKSFAVTMFDPDAPTNGGWWHWIIYNIPSTITNLPAGAGNISNSLAPAGSVQSYNDYGTPGYGGACPPRGSKPHRYVFTVYALKIDNIELSEGTTGGQADHVLKSNSLAKTSITAIYGR